MEEILRRYSDEEIKKALDYIDAGIDDGYLVLDYYQDEIEMEIVEAAIESFKQQLKGADQ